MRFIIVRCIFPLAVPQNPVGDGRTYNTNVGNIYNNILLLWAILNIIKIK